MSDCVYACCLVFMFVRARERVCHESGWVGFDSEINVTDCLAGSSAVIGLLLFVGSAVVPSLFLFFFCPFFSSLPRGLCSPLDLRRLRGCVCVGVCVCESV